MVILNVLRIWILKRNMLFLKILLLDKIKNNIISNENFDVLRVIMFYIEKMVNISIFFFVCRLNRE